jgi:phage shock protein PspC (stress-responsive transcriptional regulator)
MKRRNSAFVGFCYDFVVGDDWSVAVGVIAALALTYGLGATTIPLWWVLPAAVLVVLPLSLWRVARRTATDRQTAPAAAADNR